MDTLTCIDRAGQRCEFLVEMDRDQFRPVWYFRVYAVPPLPDGDFFDLALTEVDPQTVRITAITANGHPEYSGKGIPPALLQYAHARLGRTIVSSPTNGGAGTWRTTAATKMWERMRADGKASYDPGTDIYTFIP